MEDQPAQIAVNAPAATIQLVGIVRDKDGNPKFDDPFNVPAAVFKSLTPKDIEYLNKLRNK